MPRARLRYEPGMRFYDLTIVALAPKLKPNQGNYWFCRCERCGDMAVIRGKDMRNGNTKTCGCEQFIGLRPQPTRHGGCGTPEYHSWIWVRHGYPGDPIPAEWDGLDGFAAFRDYMGERPSFHRMARHDDTKPHGPGNTYWKPMANVFGHGNA